MAADTVYKATYSSVPVYETLIKGVPVMRRRKDDWLNATQILKVAGFDKPQRTRILEREVQIGEHEKVQGGYGKYQGTWIPFPRGQELCSQYEIDGLMRPILIFRPGSVSPPPAPKHITATRAPRVPGGAANARGAGRKKQISREQQQQNQHLEALRQQQKQLDQQQQQSSAAYMARRAPLPSASEISDASIADEVESMRSASPDRTDVSEEVPSPRANEEEEPEDDNRAAMFHDMHYSSAHISSYAEKLLEFFTDPKRFAMPDFLREPPPDFNPNATIDDEGHTALHWASAMGLLEVVGYLLRAGADVTQGNAQMQTPLMRVVAFCNNYDLKVFPQIVGMLRDSVVYGDDEKRTVFHHIAIMTAQHGRAKQQAARYYAEQLLALLTKTLPAQKLQTLLNAQDRFGDTALTLAARNGAKKLWKILLAYQASPAIQNADGRTAQEYIDAHEASGRAMLLSSSPIGAGGNMAHLPGDAGGVTSTVPAILYETEVAQRTSRRAAPEMHDLMQELADGYERSLKELGESVEQARQTAREMRVEIETLRKKLDRSEIIDLDVQLRAAREDERLAKEELKSVVERSQARGLQALLADELQKDEATLSSDNDLPDDCDLLQKKLKQAVEDRKRQVDEIVTIFGDAGTGERMSDYRRLIAISTGLHPDEVDDMLGPMIELLAGSADPEEDDHEHEPDNKHEQEHDTTPMPLLVHEGSHKSEVNGDIAMTG
ncbi:Transcription factor mbp1 (MBF subunit p120) [Savitreella phatthalungensis]